MTWVSVVFLQGEEADEAFALLYDIDGVVWSGPYAESITACGEHLAQWDYGTEIEHTLYDTPPWGSQDRTVTFRDYTIAWDTGATCIGMYRTITGEN